MAQVCFRNIASGAVAQDVPMLMDTGADASIVPMSVVTSLKNPLIADRQLEVQSFDDTLSRMSLTVLEIEFCSRKIKGEFLVLDQPYGILGRNTLNKFKLLLDGPNKTWEHSP